MKASFNIEGKNIIVNFNPEDIAGLGTIEQISLELAKMAGCSKDAENGKAVLVSVDGIESNRFYKLFSTLNPNWMDAKRKIREIMEQLKGKETYWVIEKTFKINEKMISDKGTYDFRTTIVSGNCFVTKEEAEKIRDKIKFLIRSYSELDQQEKRTDLEKVLDNNTSSTNFRKYQDTYSNGEPIQYFIDFLDIDKGRQSKVSHDEPYYPGRVFYGVLEKRLLDEGYVSEDTCFTNPDTATLVCLLIAEIFDARGVKFKGIDMLSNRLEIGI